MDHAAIMRPSAPERETGAVQRILKRLLEGLGEPHEVPPRAPARAPPYYRIAVVRRIAGAIVAA